jgi:hypothetical protein
MRKPLLDEPAAAHGMRLYDIQPGLEQQESADLADDARRQGEDGVQGIEDGIAGHSDQTEGQQHRPHQRIRHEHKHRQRPAHEQQQTPQ